MGTKMLNPTYISSANALVELSLSIIAYKHIAYKNRVRVVLTYFSPSQGVKVC